MDTIKSYFKVDERKSNLKTEIVGGLLVFLAMFYIVMIQANFFGGVAIGDTKINAGSMAIATALGAGICSLIMGLTTKHPVSLASGMGVNAFVAFTLVKGGMSFEAAIAAVMMSGILFLIISLTPLQTKILNAIPDGLKFAISVGVGLFIMFVALVNSGIIAPGSTIVVLGDITNPVVILAIIGVLLAIVLWILDIKGSTIIAMGITLVIGLILFAAFPNAAIVANGDNVYLPGHGYDISNLGSIYSNSFSGLKDIIGSPFIGITEVDQTWANPEWYIAIFILLLSIMLDSTGTVFGINSGMEDFKDEDGSTFRKIMIVDSTSAIIGSFMGSTNITVYAESTVGVSYGARTGIAPIVTGILFLISIPLIPFFTPLITSSITAGAVVLVGVMMGSMIAKIDFKDKVLATASIFTITFTMLTYSIGTGIIIGLLTYVLLMVVTGKWKSVDLVLYICTPVFIFFLIAPHVIQLI